MAWIESHQSLERHPKTIMLQSLMGWDIDTTLGKLHRFWWWCVDYAENGDLRKYNDSIIANSVGLNGDQASKFVEAMVESCWIDREPYFRVHDWWDYIGLFLQRKYGDKKKDRWTAVQKLYSNCTASCTVVSATNQPNQPNQPTNQHENLGSAEKPKNIKTEISDLKKVGWDNPRIKNHFFMRGISEADIDLAMGKKF